MEINIQPSNYTKIISKITILVQDVKLNQPASINVLSKSANDELIKTDLIFIDGQDYQDWESNDEYIVNLVLTKLGYVKSGYLQNGIKYSSEFSLVIFFSGFKLEQHPQWSTLAWSIFLLIISTS
jgi:hypothetical protein